MNFLELAFAEDLTRYTKELGVSVQELASHRADIKEIVKLWAVAYPTAKREKVDQAIWDKIETVNMQRDTALFTARDIINHHFKGNSQLRTVVEVREGKSLSQMFRFSDRLNELWLTVIEEFTDFPSYRLCAECGKPFRYTSPKATYCGDACRTAASRRRRAE